MTATTPRPFTDYAQPVACPGCGRRRPQGFTETDCMPCARTGSSFRLVGPEELEWMADRDERAGYPDIAKRRRRGAQELRELGAPEVIDVSHLDKRRRR